MEPHVRVPRQDGVDELPVAAAVLVGVAIPEPTLQGVLGFPTDGAREIHNELRNTIQNLTTVAECGTFYDLNAHYKECLRLLRSSQSAYMSNSTEGAIIARERWSRNWADATHNQQDWARALDECRKTALKLLYRVCDLATNPRDETLEAINPPGETLQAETVLRDFQMRRMYEILVLCLSMDRANCLYNMTDTLSNALGLGWYAEGQEQQYQNLGVPPLPLNRSGHTINKRLVRLQMALFNDDPVVNYWLMPHAPIRFFPGENA